MVGPSECTPKTDAEGDPSRKLTKNTMQNSRPAAMRTANKNSHPICRVWSQRLKNHRELYQKGNFDRRPEVWLNGKMYEEKENF